MSISVGDTLPETTFMTMGANAPEPVSSKEFFAGETVALFAVPGAFTPTCSAKHLPGFKEKADELRSKGITKIACTSVNDVFVMDAWGKDQSVGEDVVMLADGNGTFAKTLGLEMDGSGFGMGSRSKRYSMVVEDGKVTQLNVEEGPSFEVSSADYMLKSL
ncbi:MAG: peroxiredoxin [Ponticaulis sp.]|nr:peroxiredoxin [Ponticaulis sp.]